MQDETDAGVLVDEEWLKTFARRIRCTTNPQYVVDGIMADDREGFWFRFNGEPSEEDPPGSFEVLIERHFPAATIRLCNPATRGFVRRLFWTFGISDRLKGN